LNDLSNGQQRARHSERSLSIVAARSDAETDPREDQTEANARAIAAAETFRATARREKAPGSLALKTEPGPPMTLGNAAEAKFRLIVWCRDFAHQVEPNPTEQAQRYGAETRFSIGASGWSVQNAGAGKSMWLRPALGVSASAAVATS
jgi:hypothetical protein